MNSGDSNVILSFSERLALDQAVRALAEAPNAYELERRARTLAEKGEPVLSALLRQLDTEDPTLRGGLGLLAQNLDHDAVVPALQLAAADARRTPAARLTAVMLLERYLQVALDPRLSQTLPEPAEVARQSAEQALAMSETSPRVLVEYAEQLLAEPPEVVHAVLNVIEGISDPRRAAMLLSIAAYAPDQVTQRIIALLGSTRDPQCLIALRVLHHLAAEHLRPAIDRQTRKQRLAGLRAQSDPILRALWSPTNAQGHSLLWFVQQETAGAAPNLLTLVLHDVLGVVHADANAAVAAGGLPMPAPTGHVHRLRFPGSHHFIRLAEIQPVLGFYLLEQAIATMRGLEMPLPAELVVFGHWLWAAENAPAAEAAWPHLPPSHHDASSEQFDALLKHMAFAAWAWDLPDASNLLKPADDADRPLRWGSEAHAEVAWRLVHGEDEARLVARLGQQARWLSLTGDLAASALTLAAQAAVKAHYTDHPFVQALAWRSLLTAAADRAAETTLRLITTS